MNKKTRNILLIVGVLLILCAGCCIFSFAARELGILPDTAATEEAEARAENETATTIALTPTDTLPPTNTATITPTPSDTPLPTRTFTPSNTPTLTNTPRPTNTPPPTETLSPEDIARETILSIDHGRIEDDDIEYIVANELVITLRYYLTTADLSTSSARHQIETEFPRFVCNLREAGFTTQNFQFTGMGTYLDAGGNAFQDKIVEMVMTAEQGARINCDAPDSVNLPALADRYDLNHLYSE